MIRWIDFAITHRLLLWLVTASLLVMGVLSWQQTPIDAFPNVSSPQVKIILKAPGMTPQEIETRITAVVETELLGIPKQVSLRSTTKYALTDITLTFSDDTDIYWARQQVSERLANIKSHLPSQVEGGIAPMTTPLSDVMMFTVDSPTLSLADRRQLLDWVIRPALRSIAGVADVNTLGGEVRTFEVEPDPARLLAHNITLAQLQQALTQNNQNDGEGRLIEGEETLIVRSIGQLDSPEQIASLPISEQQQQLITVGDVAKVRLGSLTRYGGVTRNGEGETVQGIVLAMIGTDTQQLLKHVEDKLDSLRQQLPEHVDIHIFYHRGQLIDRAIAGISHALMEAIMIVMVMLILFLGHWRAAFTVAILLPAALLISFIWLHISGVSANLMSLGGLMIALGLLVDNGVVVVENILHHLQKPKQHRLPKLHIIANAVKEIALPVSLGMSIIVLLFMPLLTLEDIEGKLFKPVVLGVISTLVSALLLALLVIPAIATHTLPSHVNTHPRWQTRLETCYAKLLIRLTPYTSLLIIIAIASLMGSWFLFNHIGKVFTPSMDEGDLIVQLEKTPSISLEASLALDTRVQQALLAQVPEIDSIVARVGSDEMGLDPMGLNDTDSFVKLKPAAQWRHPYDKESVKHAITQVLAQFPGIETTLTQPIEMRVSEMLTGSRGDIVIKLFGHDVQQLSQLAERLKHKLSDIKGIQDIFTPTNEGLAYLDLTLDHTNIQRFGLSVDDVQTYLKSQLEGVDAGWVYQSNRRIPIVLRGAGILDAQMSDLSQLPLISPYTQEAQLGDIAHIQRTEGAIGIIREQGQRLSSLMINVSGRDLSSVVHDIQQRLVQFPLPEGYHLTIGGQFENQQRVNTRLSWLIPIEILLVALLLTVSLASWRLAILALSTVPFALIGGVVSLYFSGLYLSLPASIGFIALLGIAILNGVVLLDTYQQLHRQPHIVKNEIYLLGSVRRLRPVLMTASIAALSLTPLLFTTGPGSEIQRPLAVVIMGGLLSSTLLTLVLLPLLYRYITRENYE